LQSNGLYATVFAKMINSSFKAESITNEIELTGKALEDILDLLEAIYPNFPKAYDGIFNVFFVFNYFRAYLNYKKKINRLKGGTLD
jgi:hypothetical protein